MRKLQQNTLQLARNPCHRGMFTVKFELLASFIFRESIHWSIKIVISWNHADFMH